MMEANLLRLWSYDGYPSDKIASTIYLQTFINTRNSTSFEEALKGSVILR